MSAIELAWRLLGFGNPPLLQADANAGYIFASNQLVYRFGNRIEYNQFSQRSEQIDSAKTEGTLRILMIGDSVLNGNNTTDRKETIPELFEAPLLGIKKQVEVLNASVGSWGNWQSIGIYSNPCRSCKFFTPPQPSPRVRSGSKKFTNDLGWIYSQVWHF
ncbi:hypothetical protein QUB56_18625 [Microcoleus sp. AR_TQ3_B6]|uniref:hypothetical protein n=1 Tax=Microcoleus sp. AR_TQ3_B6 TaxID=3055284 RepID=UPI002FD04B48